MKASGHEAKDSEIKCAMLLNLIGEEALDLFNTFDLSEEDKKDYDKVMDAFEGYTSPKSNVVMERFKFNMRNQQHEEPFTNFLTDLKRLIKSCEFGDQQDSLLRDRIILGIADKSLQERMLREVDLSLEKIVKLCRATEMGRDQAKELQGHISLKGQNCIDAVSSRQGYSGQHKNSSRPSNNSVDTNNGESRLKLYDKNKPKSNFSKDSNNETYNCKKCGRNHGRRDCPAYGKKCNICHKMNHFAVGCNLKPKPDRPNPLSNQVASVGLGQNQIGPNGNESNNEILFLDSIHKPKFVPKTNQWYETLVLNDRENVLFKLDSGAEVNTCSLELFEKLQQKDSSIKLSKSNMILKAYGGSQIDSVGIVNLKCRPITKNTSETVEFFVIKTTNDVGILGLDSCLRFDLIKRVDEVTTIKAQDRLEKTEEDQIKQRFVDCNSDVFNGIGKFKVKCHFDVDPSVKVTVKPPRRIPMTIQPKVQKALNELENQGIICKVDHPKSFVSNLVVVEKPNGDVRLCIDPTDLNQATKRTPHLIPCMQDISQKLSNKSIFSVLDLKDGFYNIELDEESSDHCAFSTPYGMYKFQRLPFGLNLAPEIFQKFTEQIFGQIKGVVVYFDDILIAGSDEREHDLILKQVVDKARENNIKFNKTKFQYKVKSVKYFGEVYSQGGHTPDPDRVRAINGLESPKNKKELQRLLGLFNFVRDFVPKMSEVTSPLRELLRKDVAFLWMPKHEEALNKLKNLISKAPVLVHFDDSKPITLQCDSSKDGMGFSLMQNGRPVMYGSKSLTDTQVGYCQTEKEMLSICEAVKKYHNLLYGRVEIEVQTDHKPLVSIMCKNIANINNNRLQRMRLKLLNYNLKVRYVPGKNMYVADCLSRSYLKDKVYDDSDLVEVVHTLSKNAQVSDSRKSEILDETKNDDTLTSVIKYIREGWPNTKLSIPNHVKFYFQLQDRLTVDDGLLFLDHRIIIPKSLRNKMLYLLHEPHMGMEKTKLKARMTVYWPNINTDIEQIVSKCTVCEQYRANNTKEPMLSHSVPDLPFEKVAVDLLDCKGKPYLVLIDYYSKWLELKSIRNKQASEIILKLKSIFSEHGVPKQICSDNMPFNSYEFIMFSKEWDIECIYSSPRYPKSNGMAERAVQIAKNILNKSNNESEAFVALLEYRSTPVKSTGLAPCQVLMSRLLRSKIPVSKDVLKPKMQLNVKDKITHYQNQSKSYYDKNSKVKKCFKTPNVVYRKDGLWKPAQIVGKAKGPRSYLIREENGRILTRNSHHLKQSYNTPTCTYNDDTDILGEQSVPVNPNVVLPNENNHNVYNNVFNEQNVDPANHNLDGPIVQNDENSVYHTRSGRPVRLPVRYS